MTEKPDTNVDLNPRLTFSSQDKLLFSYEDVKIELLQKSYLPAAEMVEKYNQIASDLEDMLFFLKKFIDLQHIQFRYEDHGAIGRTRVYLSHKNYRKFQLDMIKNNKNIGQTKTDRAYILQSDDNDFFTIYYNKNGISIKDFSLKFLLLATEDVPKVFTNKSLNVREIIPLIMLLKRGADTSLIHAGVEVTMDNRVNFVSLYTHQYFFRVTAINEITKVKKGSVTKTSIAQAAAKGFNATLLSLFYINNFFTEDPDLIKQFNGMPIEWLDTILNTRK